MRTWYGFDDYIFNAACKFYGKYGVFPKVVAVNEHTYQQMCFLVSVSPKRKYIVEDEGEEIIQIGEFSYPDCSIEVDTTDDLKDREFMLIFDDRNEDDDEDSDEPTPPNGKEILEEVLYEENMY